MAFGSVSEDDIIHRLIDSFLFYLVKLYYPSTSFILLSRRRP